jgi:hypothetical protein
MADADKARDPVGRVRLLMEEVLSLWRLALEKKISVEARGCC